MKIKITADSTCDLSPELLTRYDITLAPLAVLIDDAVYHDGIDVDPSMIFQAAAEGKTVKTAAVNTFEYTELFRACLKKYDAVIHICIGQAFSACYANASQAAAEFPNVYVINSRNLSTGSAHLVLDAAEMAESGMDAADIASRLKEETPLVDASFVIEQVDFLYRGGRCSGVEAVGAKLLHIKPSIEVTDGKMVVGKKYRGSFERCLEHYIKDKLTNRAQIDFSRVFITHSPCDPGVVDFVKDVLDKNADFRSILETNAGCTVSTHCGPNTLGVLFKRKVPKA